MARGKVLGGTSAAVIAAILGYSGWAIYSANTLQTRLDSAKASLAGSSSSAAFLDAVRQLMMTETEARAATRPMFTARFENIASQARAELLRAPSLAAEWVHQQRKEAWGAVGQEDAPADRIDDATLRSFIERLNETNSTGLAVQDELAHAAVALEARPEDFTGFEELTNEISITAVAAADTAQVGREMIKVKARARESVQSALRQIDVANRQVEEYAELHVLRSVYEDWADAFRSLLQASTILNSRPAFRTTTQNQFALALAKDDQIRIDSIIEQVSPKVQQAHTELRRAEHAESTAAGRLSRGVGRLFSRARGQVAESRIGKEVALAFKTMVLGTKAMYDLMEVGPNDDITDWAMSYESDLDQLSAEAEAVRQSDGWSLTGKNTFVESLVDSAYEESFKDSD